MRLVLQRVKRGSVLIDGTEKREIGPGLVVLVGMCPEDTLAECAFLAKKMAELRIFDDGEGNMNLSLLDVEGECLIVSQFTLYANCRKGRRPSFIDAAPPSIAENLYRQFVEEAGNLGIKNIKTGEFGADMEVELLNDGPVTIILDSDQLSIPGKG